MRRLVCAFVVRKPLKTGFLTSRPISYMRSARLMRDCICTGFPEHLLLAYATPTKRSNAQHLVEYEKQLIYEANPKSGNVMQWIPTSVVQNGSQKVLSFCQIYFSCKIRVPEFDRNVFIARNMILREYFLSSYL